jgi:hypothetical protein
MARGMSFQIRIHDAQDLIEVVYPAQPSEGDVAEYVLAIQRAIRGMRGDWDCLVDQRQLKVMPPALVEEVSRLNAWAKRHRMRRSARVVASAVGGLQANRMAREAALRVEVKSFSTRAEALAWLTQERVAAK